MTTPVCQRCGDKMALKEYWNLEAIMTGKADPGRPDGLPRPSGKSWAHADGSEGAACAEARLRRRIAERRAAVSARRPRVGADQGYLPRPSPLAFWPAVGPNPRVGSP